VLALAAWLILVFAADRQPRHHGAAGVTSLPRQRRHSGSAVVPGLAVSGEHQDEPGSQCQHRDNRDDGELFGGKRRVRVRLGIWGRQLS